MKGQPRAPRTHFLGNVNIRFDGKNRFDQKYTRIITCEMLKIDQNMIRLWVKKFNNNKQLFFKNIKDYKEYPILCSGVYLERNLCEI